jgi:hypothetical protein
MATSFFILVDSLTGNLMEIICARFFKGLFRRAPPPPDPLPEGGMKHIL